MTEGEKEKKRMTLEPLLMTFIWLVMIKCLWFMVRLLYNTPRKDECIRFTVSERGCVNF